jgi:anthranilate phosphoribosyltransferase
MNPMDGPALVVSSYTHPEYAASMAATFDLFDTAALLLRGTEGEPVADARRTPRMVLVNDGVAQCVQEAQVGPLTTLPRVPTIIDAATTADFTRAVMEGRLPAPAPITLQVEHIVRACKALEAAYDPTLLQPLVTPA